MQSELWEDLLKIYKEKLNLEPRIVNLVAVYDILRLCTQGLANKSIAKMLDFEEDYVKEVFKEFLQFDGWEEDLDFSPLYIFKNHSVKTDFMQNIENISPATHSSVAIKSYDLCKLLQEIERDINEQYSNS